MNLNKLEESILLLADFMELKANPNAPASGVVVEAKIDKSQGPLATILVQRGTLRVGDIISIGRTFGKIKKMFNDKGKVVKEALPSMPVEIIGLETAPEAGDKFVVLDSEKQAKEIAEYRERTHREIKTAMIKKTTLEELFSKASGVEKVKNLNIIVKADVQGSIEAISASLLKLSNPEVQIRILHSGVGGITESDVNLAKVSKGVIVGFNVRAHANTQTFAEREGVDIRYYSIIYALLDDIKLAITGMLTPVLREQFLGNAEIRMIIPVSRVGKIAGCYVTKGIVKRNAKVRLLRDNVVVFDGNIKALRRFKDDVKEVRENFECGILIENYDDIKEKDMLEIYEVISEAATL